MPSERASLAVAGTGEQACSAAVCFARVVVHRVCRFGPQLWAAPFQGLGEAESLSVSGVTKAGRGGALPQVPCREGVSEGRLEPSKGTSCLSRKPADVCSERGRSRGATFASPLRAAPASVARL